MPSEAAALVWLEWAEENGAARQHRHEFGGELVVLSVIAA